MRWRFAQAVCMVKQRLADTYSTGADVVIVAAPQSCNELYKRNPLPEGMTPEQEAKKLRAGKGEGGRDFSTACPMRSVVEKKWQDLQTT